MAEGPKQSILIVDDQPENIRILASLLKGKYRQMVATSGPKALELARSENPPDLILLDVMMPDMDGHEVCRRLKADQRTREVPVIFITAMSEEEDETKGFDLGAVDYITKPFSPCVVEARVRTHLELQEKTEIIRREREQLALAHEELRRTMARIQADISLAAEIQNGMLPVADAQPFRDRLTIVTRFNPQSQVGGDFFDFKRLDDRRLGIILADVSGHGLQAAFITGLIKTYFELAGQARLCPEQFALHLNDALHRLTPPGSFATMIYCVYDVETRGLRYLNGGHSPVPILVLPDGHTAPISTESNMLLGAVEVEGFQEQRFTMPQGAKLLLATDGLIEAMCPEGKLFGYDRLISTVRQKSDASTHELDKAIFDALSCFTKDAEQSDDIAALVLEFQ